jgi:subtilisin family serine protease
LSRTLSLVSFFAVLAPGSLFGQAPDGRLDAALRQLLRPDVRDEIRRTAQLPAEAAAAPPPTQLGTQPFANASRAAGALAIDREAPGAEPRVGVIVRLRTPSAAEELRAAGARVGVVVGNIATAWVPLNAFERVAGLQSLDRIEAARAVTTVHDTSMIAIHADGLRQLVGDRWTGATGEGVIVGIYDTGLDFRHADFLDAAGRTRVIALWDQVNTQLNPPTGFTQGYYCTQDAIQRAIDTGDNNACPQIDGVGHGTHVAGSAAGDGSAPGSGPTQYRFVGVAPNADLLIVRGGPGIFFENLIVEGLAFMKGQALERGKPAVVNLSLGGLFGAHDGSRLYEQVIDSLSGPGFIVVVSAGNSGWNANTVPQGPERPLIHARGFAQVVQPVEFEVEICSVGQSGCAPYTPSVNRCAGNAVELSLWYEASDRLRIEVFRPSGSSVSVSRGIRSEADDATGRILIDNGSGGPNPENGDVEALIFIDGCGSSGAPQAGTWKIRVTPEVPGSGSPYDMWIYRSVLGSNGISRGRAGFDNRFIVASPGNATSAVTVGAFATRMCWPSQAASGQSCYTEREQIGDLARFSSAGPRRDGRLKPEIVAPGIGIASARSRDFFPPTSRLLSDNVHWILEGTSMSAPHVTGAIAVLLQANPSLDPVTVKAVLQTTATRDGFTTRTYGALGESPLPSDWWGYGKLNVRDALLSIGATAPAVLAIEAEPAAPDTAVLGRQGTRLPLLQLHFESKGDEAINVLGLSFNITGKDPGARLVLVRDANGNGLIDPSEPVLGSASASLPGGQTRIELTPDSLRVPALGTVVVIAALQLSGNGPHGATFQAELVAPSTVSIGTVSLSRNPLEIVGALPSGPAETSVLRSDQSLAFSENPVRGERVHFQFAQTPTRAAVYTLTGRRVVDLLSAIGSGRTVTWDLTNEEGDRVAPGVYLVIFTVGGRTFREKIIILTPSAPPEGSPE